MKVDKLIELAIFECAALDIITATAEKLLKETNGGAPASSDAFEATHVEIDTPAICQSLDDACAPSLSCEDGAHLVVGFSHAG